MAETNSASAKVPPRPPAHVAPYVAALGADKAADFLMKFGGAGIYLPEHRPSLHSEWAKFVGADLAEKLISEMGGGEIKVPTAKKWLAAYFRVGRGLKVAEIARTLHVSEWSVRQYLRGAELSLDVEPVNSDQLDLFNSGDHSP